MEHTGFEPVTSTLPVWRAPNCANAPNGCPNKHLFVQARYMLIQLHDSALYGYYNTIYREVKARDYLAPLS